MNINEALNLPDYSSPYTPFEDETEDGLNRLGSDGFPIYSSNVDFEA